MMVMTAKVNLKKILIYLAAAAGLILLIVMLMGGGNEAAPTAAAAVTTNDDRVTFLESFGWDVAASPVETGQVRIPLDSTEVFGRYNALQKSQGYDLSAFAGKNVMRYVYQVSNYPGSTEPVYATLLIYKDQVIGGDVTDTAATGHIQGFTMPGSTEATTPTQATAPTKSGAE